ncbi:hypothetical protein KC367_g219 [Hortaea werneckii]|nr:hypothetical protein KC367_g219 [Hortaea werneckii]
MVRAFNGAPPDELPARLGDTKRWTSPGRRLFKDQVVYKQCDLLAPALCRFAKASHCIPISLQPLFPRHSAPSQVEHR